jgi:hypothetical protein
VTVTGISDGSSSGSTTKLTGTANGMVASINITCAWDYSFALQKPSITAEPRPYPEDPSKFIIKYNVNPPTAKISYVIDESIAQVNVDTGKKEITVTPTKEGKAVLTVMATNLYNNYQFATQTCNLNFKYNSYTLKTSVVSKTGKYSLYDDNTSTIRLGDGEKISMNFKILQANANAEISEVKFKPVNGVDYVSMGEFSSNEWQLSHNRPTA